MFRLVSSDELRESNNIKRMAATQLKCSLDVPRWVVGYDNNLLGKVFRSRSNFVSLERERSRLSPKASVHTTCVTKLIPSFTPSPHRCVVSTTVTTFRSNVVRVRLIRCAPIVICINEFLRSKFVSLLQVQTTCVTERLHCGWISAPQRSSLRMTMGATFARFRTIETIPPRTMRSGSSNRGRLLYCVVEARGRGGGGRW